MSPKKRILYFHIGLSSFVKKDIEILERNYIVEVVYYDLTKKSAVFGMLFKQFFTLILRTRKTDIFFSQFGGYHTLLPSIFARIFGRKAVIVLGGTDTVSFPSIKYGAFAMRFMKYFVRKSYQWCHLLLPVSKNLVFTEYNYTDDDGRFQGYEYFCRGVNSKHKVIYNGYSGEKWCIGQKEELSFVTVGANLNSRFAFKLKGIDLVLELAKRMPIAKFYIVGGQSIENLPENVVGIGNMNQLELAQFLSTKAFYLQLSMSEGFPNALCEGMLSGCLPIVSNVGAMSEIVPDNKLVLKKKDLQQLLSIVDYAIQLQKEVKPEFWRNIILDNYTLTRREAEIKEALSELFA